MLVDALHTISHYKELEGYYSDGSDRDQGILQHLLFLSKEFLARPTQVDTDCIIRAGFQAIATG